MTTLVSRDLKTCLASHGGVNKKNEDFSWYFCAKNVEVHPQSFMAYCHPFTWEFRFHKIMYLSKYFHVILLINPFLQAPDSFLPWHTWVVEEFLIRNDVFVCFFSRCEGSYYSCLELHPWWFEPCTMARTHTHHPTRTLF